MCAYQFDLPRDIIWIHTHLVQYLPAFVSATQQKQPQSPDGWKRRLKKDVNRCISTIFIDAMSSIQFQTLMVWLTTYFFFFFQNTFFNRTLSQSMARATRLLHFHYFIGSLYVQYSCLCNMIPMENMGSFQVNRMLNKFFISFFITLFFSL